MRNVRRHDLSKGTDGVFEFQSLTTSGTKTLASAPTISSRARLRVAPTVSANTQSLQLGTYWVRSFGLFSSPGSPTQVDDGDVDLPIANRQFAATLTIPPALIQPVAFDVPVRRLG